MKQPRNLGRSQTRPVCAVCGEYIWKGVRRYTLRAGHLLDGSWDVGAKLCHECLMKIPGLKQFLLASRSPDLTPPNQNFGRRVTAAEAACIPTTVAAAAVTGGRK